MAGLALVVPILALSAAAAFAAMTGVTFLFLPANWPKRKRWLRAALVVLSAFAVLMLLAFGAGMLRTKPADLLL